MITLNTNHAMTKYILKDQLELGYDFLKFPNMVFQLAKKGFTNEQIAEVFSISVSKLDKWREKFPEFEEAMQKGKDEFDSDKVESALLKSALGHTVFQTTTSFDADGNVGFKQIVEKEIPPNQASAKLWLTNRRPRRWREEKNSAPTIGVLVGLKNSEIQRFKGLSDQELIDLSKSKDIENINEENIDKEIEEKSNKEIEKNTNKENTNKEKSNEDFSRDFDLSEYMEK